jgi:TolB-like protein
MTFFDELKRRNVFRVGAAYLVVAWLALQVVDTVAPLLQLPDTFGRGVLLLLVIGFPVVLLFSWAYELTDKGLKKTSEVDSDDSITHSTGQRLNRLTIMVLVIALGYFVWESRFQGGADAPDAVAETVTEKTIAVLPFASFSEDAEQAWFADGLTEEILNALARTPDLLVSSRTSSFAYKDTDKDLQTIAGELGVAHVLEGSVRRGGDRMRITAQLIRSSDGFHLWSETYDAEASDVILIQEDVATNIANALQTAMDPEALAAMVSAGTSSVAAYEAYLEANVLFQREFITGMTLKPVAKWEEAIRIDPDFASPYVRLAQYWYAQNRITALGDSQGDTPRSRTEQGNSYAEKATFLLEEGARLNYLRGLQAKNSMNPGAAIRYFEAAIAEDQSNRDVFQQLMQVYVDVGNFDKAEALIDRYVERFPRDLEFYVNKISDYVWVMNGPKAAAIATAGLADHPTSDPVAYQIHRAFLMNEQVEDARRVAMRIRGSSTLASSAKLVVQLRQACAEGKLEYASELVDQILVDPTSELSTNWLALQTVGRYDEATALIVGMDNPDEVVALGSFLTYYHFDVSRFPYLESILARDGFTRQPWQPVTFGCNAPVQ